MIPSPARILIFLLPTPSLIPPPPVRRPHRAWAGTARCAPEAVAGGGFVVIEDDLSELLQISQLELEEAQRAVGEFGGDNRAGIEGTLHRISAIRSRKGMVVGLTCRVGRAVNGHVDMVRDLLNYKESILFLGRPGVGKTTVMREIARVLADEFQKRVVNCRYK
ncbi:unnamed protein product [Triticum turgidum subsp. durum]|uniref:AAA+ ATPase domain-containing protein n=1 Tax=Triticum turgidum subsp. durum TaxID=4567 RepID=A0A9R0WKS0_TRITD|nr:unnamed protein product [Triticum turgidum subsp. durum]